MNNALLPAILLMTGLIPGTYFYPIFWLVLAYLISVRRGRIPKAALAPIAPLGLVIVAGLVFVDIDTIYDTLRDIWYFSKIFVISLTGLYLGISFDTHPRLLRRMATVAVILAVLNVGYAFSNKDVEGSRHLAYFSVFIIPFIWRHRYEYKYSSSTLRVVMIFAVMLMLVLSGSRAGILTFTISLLAAFGAFKKTSNSLLAFGLAVALLFIIWPLLPQYDAANITFLGKIQNSINELSFETGAMKLDMYVNWRGFEAYRAYETWLNASLSEQVFGLGFGTHIDLGQIVAYGDGEVDSLPSVHNAYFTLLVKTGVVGIAAMVYFLLLPFRIPFDRCRPHVVVLSQISRGSAIVLLLTMALIAGPLNKQSMDGVLLMWAWSSGALMRVRHRAHLQTRSDRATTLASCSVVGSTHYRIIMQDNG
ncbi:O-antigen ligase family protein [Sphingobium baderi]|uniref:O-antigen ligase family protein n=1 Tax=Sphingobium baderi TaxID=1332080 RepID=UPI002B40CB64|nr:O-antigen ligase family protein [Sphingobium baderi]WRD78816.1 O-antigen ligase family protein [Sphingobium baderi]